jgi:hypothetical protein
MKLVWAAANEDRATILEVSKSLGFLTGDETSDFVNGYYSNLISFFQSKVFYFYYKLTWKLD